MQIQYRIPTHRTNPRWQVLNDTPRLPRILYLERPAFGSLILLR